VVPDLEGQKFEDLNAAKQEAKASLRELVAEDITSQKPLETRSIAIKNEGGDLLAVVGMTTTVQWNCG
jgi:hypothetical protein